jgi:hypothetical protein
MKSRVLWGLVGLNVVLLCWTCVRPHSIFAQARRPDEYLMVPGVAQGAPSELVYVVDATTGQLGSVYFDDNARQLKPGVPVNMNNVFNNKAR